MLTATDDQWAQAAYESEKRATKWQEARIEHRRMILAGFGWVVGALIGGAVILGLGWYFYDSVQGTREGDIRIEQERTEQIRACTDLTEPLERQYCLLAIGMSSPERDAE